MSKYSTRHAAKDWKKISPGEEEQITLADLSQHNEAIRDEFRAYVDSDNFLLKCLAQGIVNKDGGIEAYRILALDRFTFDNGSEEARVADAIMKKYGIPRLGKILKMQSAEDTKAIEERTKAFREERDNEMQRENTWNIFYFLVWICSFIAGFFATSFYTETKRTHKRAQKYLDGDG